MRKAGSPAASSVTVSWAPTVAVSPDLVTVAVTVTLPAATPIAWQPTATTLTVAIPVFDDVQVQLADEPASPPEALTANATLFPTTAVAEAGAIEAVSADAAGPTGVAGSTTCVSSPQEAAPIARSPATRAERYGFSISIPSGTARTYRRMSVEPGSCDGGHLGRCSAGPVRSGWRRGAEEHHRESASSSIAMAARIKGHHCNSWLPSEVVSWRSDRSKEITYDRTHVEPTQR